MRRSWSYADDRRVIELAKASKSLEEAARIMNARQSAFAKFQGGWAFHSRRLGRRALF
jgi:hypothetical protein